MLETLGRGSDLALLTADCGSDVGVVESVTCRSSSGVFWVAMSVLKVNMEAGLIDRKPPYE